MDLRIAVVHVPVAAFKQISSLALWLLLWIAAAHAADFSSTWAVPDIAAGLTLALTLHRGAAGGAVAALGWLICYYGHGAIGYLAAPPLAAVHLAVFGLFPLVVRRHVLDCYTQSVRGLCVLWGFCAATAALAATASALFAAADQSNWVFLQMAGRFWLTALAGIALVLVPFLRTAPIRSAAANLSWLPAALLSCGAMVAITVWPLPFGDATLLALLASIALLGACIPALCAGLGGVAVHGLLLAVATLWLAVTPQALTLGPAWLALVMAIQIAASLLAAAQESRWRMAAQRIQHQHALQQQARAQLLDLVASHSSDIISVHDAHFDFCLISPPLRELLGLAADEQPGKIAELLPRLHPSDRPESLPAAIDGAGRWRFRIRGGDHRWHWLESSYTAVGEGAERRYVVITRDIGAHVEQTESLHAMALHDPLTQLYNRRAANSLGEQLWQEVVTRRMPFAVILLDIDHFKKINDTYGHDTGDEVIKRVASILPAHTRQRDMACRWGGEEFLILLPESDTEGACQIAERVRGEVASTVVIVGNLRVQIHISAGVAERTDNDAELAAVIERADQGLYAAKEQGRNRVVPILKAS